ncbi:3-hydroxybutyryl-CoA dehydrogenase [Streptomyces sp. NPDC048751]|uniref:3-hydroxybutyryl-CoA dehydrogenase n=1 Tax=Streptomyces sp. NPDC048751 TaxID=3365591 RepID=UPI00371EBCD9
MVRSASPAASVASLDDARDDVRRVGVVGAGLMGSGIAEVCARAGLDVVVRETGHSRAAAGQRRVTASLDRGVRRGRLTEADRDTALHRIRFTTDLADMADRDAVIEAVAEDEQVKTDVFTALDKVVTRPSAILATNTSSIPIMKLAMVTSRPDQVIGIHFFNPVPVLELVELVPSLLTSSQTRRRAENFVVGMLGKQVIGSQDRAGFVVNALLVPYLLSAIRMLESGFASADDIDNGMVLGCAHPMGPLRLADLIGLDTLKAIADSMCGEFKEPLHSPPPLLLRMVDAGLLGKKTGRGFHDHTRQGAPQGTIVVPVSQVPETGR